MNIPYMITSAGGSAMSLVFAHIPTHSMLHFMI